MDERTRGRRAHRGRRCQDQGGAAAVEYAIVLAAIAGAIVVVAFTIGSKILGALTSFNSSIP